jgi:hypothetical protein
LVVGCHVLVVEQVEDAEDSSLQGIALGSSYEALFTVLYIYYLDTYICTVNTCRRGISIVSAAQ